MDAHDTWVDGAAGPVVRPYAVTGGRTEPAGGQALDLVTIVVASRQPAGEDHVRLAPEHRRILSVCREPVTVADIASAVALPVGVARVLLADLLQAGSLVVVPSRSAGGQPSPDLLREVLNGLHAL